MKMIMIGEYVRILKQSIVAYFSALSRRSLVETRKSQDTVMMASKPAEISAAYLPTMTL
jgi:hypothetical protein